MSVWNSLAILVAVSMMIWGNVSLVFAHSGGTDSSGCHAGNRLYHCHNRKTSTPRPLPPSPRPTSPKNPDGNSPKNSQTEETEERNEEESVSDPVTVRISIKTPQPDKEGKPVNYKSNLKRETRIVVACEGKVRMDRGLNGGSSGASNIGGAVVIRCD